MGPFILIVDDEPTVRKVLTEMLSDTHFQPVEAASAGDALKLLRQRGPQISVLITDIRRPGILDGLDLAKFTRNSWPWIKIIVTTGFAESVEDLPDNVRFLPKPWRVDEMMACVLNESGEFLPMQSAGGVR